MHSVSSLSILLLASVAVAQTGTAHYVPDNQSSVGPCNVSPFGNTAASATWVNQRYQTVVTAADLGYARTLVTGLGFAPCSTGVHQTRRLTITMALVPPGFVFANAGENDFVANLALTGTARVVLDRADYGWQKIADTWSSIGLDTSFPYDGTSDLLIDILAVGNDSTDGNGAMHRDTRPRLYATAWSGSPPATGIVGAASAKLQIQTGCADMTTYGRGCNGLTLTASGSSAPGQTAVFGASGGAPNLPIVLNLGLRNTAPYPIDLSPVNLPGCALLNDAVVSAGTSTDGLGNATVSIPIPASFSNHGLRLFEQFVHVNPSLPTLFALSNGARIVVGPTCP